MTTSRSERVAHSLSPREAFDRCSNGAVILDVREEYSSQYKKFGVPEVLQIPLSRLRDEVERIPRDRWLIVADSSGVRSGEAVAVLRERGFTQLSDLAGGMVEWERDGLPIVADTGQRLSGSCACQLRAREGKKGGDKES